MGTSAFRALRRHSCHRLRRCAGPGQPTTTQTRLALLVRHRAVSRRLFPTSSVRAGGHLCDVRIAQVSPLYEAVPPRLYGGTERVVAALSDALVDLGHDVTLFATAESQTKGLLSAVRPQALRLDNSQLKSELAAHLCMLHEVRQQAKNFDVLHFHTDLIHFPVFEPLAAKCVTTLHGRLDVKDLEPAFRRWPNFGLVSISEQQRLPLPNANWISNVPHGLPPDHFRFNPSSGSYLAFLGRMSPEKGPEVAIRLALKAEMPLKMAAKVDAVDRTYFTEVVKPLLNHSLIEFVGEISEADKSKFLGEASALLFPIRWPEPFGLVMIEAMACGTPVIAFAAGSVQEVIQDGCTGFVVHSEEQALAALRTVNNLRRAPIRAVFEQRFTARRMARDYLDVYSAALAPQRRQLARVS